MKRFFKLAAVCAAFVLSGAMCASASSDKFSGQLTGASGTESGSFTFTSSNSTSGTFSDIKLSFAGSTFGNVNTSNGGGQATCANGFCGIWWQTTVGADTIWDGIIINMANGQFEDVGYIANSQNKGGFNYMSVPEGGSRLAYLLMSAVALFAGFFMAGKNRRIANLS